MTVVSETIMPPASSVSAAAVRSRVTVPLRFPDGYMSTAEVLTFHGLADGKEHLLLALGAWEQALPDPASASAGPLVRLHSECMTGDVFGSQRCDCGPQLREAVEEITAAGGATTVRLLTNNPDKAAQLTALGIEITEQVPTRVHLSLANHRYLAAKRDHTAHTLNLPMAAGNAAGNRQDHA
ncbi:GTP cyclohydrolase [Arthrobacter sp. NPDC093128]|uniref:GTP cyclohydrolase n=1 Tax=Arthrobacter sp. NPDC093128 TaxID=3154979 RepID=UPI0034228498